jgi:hypothetical protein
MRFRIFNIKLRRDMFAVIPPSTDNNGSVGAPLEESGALPGNLHPALNQSGLATKVEITSRHHASHSCLLNAIP